MKTVALCFALAACTGDGLDDSTAIPGCSSCAAGEIRRGRMFAGANLAAANAAGDVAIAAGNRVGWLDADFTLRHQAKLPPQTDHGRAHQLAIGDDGAVVELVYT